jgi:hypothetical protein
MLKKKYNFVDEYTKKWSFINKRRSDVEAYCCVCNSYISVSEYIFSVPANNASVERIFSLMAAQWTDERNRLNIDTIESILQCHYNFNMTCSQFYNYVKTNPSMLAAVEQSENTAGFLITCNNNSSVFDDDTRANYVCFKIIYIILTCNVLSRFQFQNLWQP